MQDKRMEISAALLRDLDRVAKHQGIARKAMVEAALRQVFAASFVELDQSAANVQSYWRNKNVRQGLDNR